MRTSPEADFLHCALRVPPSTHTSPMSSPRPRLSPGCQRFPRPNATVPARTSTVAGASSWLPPRLYPRRGKRLEGQSGGKGTRRKDGAPVSLFPQPPRGLAVGFEHGAEGLEPAPEGLPGRCVEPWTRGLLHFLGLPLRMGRQDSLRPQGLLAFAATVFCSLFIDVAHQICHSATPGLLGEVGPTG